MLLRYEQFDGYAKYSHRLRPVNTKSSSGAMRLAVQSPLMLGSDGSACAKFCCDSLTADRTPIIRGET